MSDGTWRRLTVCVNDACQWAFLRRIPDRYREVVLDGDLRQPGQAGGLASPAPGGTRLVRLRAAEAAYRRRRRHEVNSLIRHRRTHATGLPSRTCGQRDAAWA